MMAGRETAVDSGDVEHGALAYERARELARDRDAKVREKLARRTDVAPEILYYLAEDDDQAVRRAIAGNTAAPRQADLLLVADPSQDVRIDLAHKIGQLTPELSADEHQRLSTLAGTALRELANDALPEIRGIIAESIKDMDDVPHDLVRQLAHDVELVVAAPILEYSPLLTDDDLLEIINSDPVRGGLSAISRRANLPGTVSDAVAATDDEDAITHLLANESAQIREETLDALVEQAQGHEPWHRPLAGRPNLSAKAAGNIARLVSAAVLREMEQSNRLSPEMARQVASKVESRLDGNTASLSEAEIEAGLMGVEAATHAFERGAIDETLFHHHIARNDILFVKNAMALLTHTTPLTIGRILSGRNGEAIMALTWRSGLPMAVATELQAKVARLSQSAIVKPGPDDGYPMSDMQMERILSEFFD